MEIWAGRDLLEATSQISGTGTLLRSLGVRFYLELTQSRPALPNPTPPSSLQHWSLLMTGYGLLVLLLHSAPYSMLSQVLDLSTNHPHCPRHWIQFKKKKEKKRKQKTKTETQTNNKQQNKRTFSWAWSLTPTIPEHKRQRQEDVYQFAASLAYIVSFNLAKAM